MGATYIPMYIPKSIDAIWRSFSKSKGATAPIAPVLTKALRHKGQTIWISSPSYSFQGLKSIWFGYSKIIRIVLLSDIPKSTRVCTYMYLSIVQSMYSLGVLIRIIRIWKQGYICSLFNGKLNFAPLSGFHASLFQTPGMHPCTPANVPSSTYPHFIRTDFVIQILWFLPLKNAWELW